MRLGNALRGPCWPYWRARTTGRPGSNQGAGQWRRGRLRPLRQRVPGAHCALNAQDDAATGRCVRGAPGRRLPCRKVEQSMRAAGAYSAAQRRLMVWSTWPFTVLGTCKRLQIRGVHSGSRWYIDGCLTPSIVPSFPAVYPGPLKSRSRGLGLRLYLEWSSLERYTLSEPHSAYPARLPLRANYGCAPTTDARFLQL